MFKKDQKVWCAMFGEGVVTEIQHESEGAYRVVVLFKGRRVVTYTTDGKYSVDSNVTLFPYPIEITKAIIKPSIDWSQIKDEYKWLAVDENDSAYVYEKEPSIDGAVYCHSINNSYFEVNGLVSYSRGTCDWQDSLVKRPN